MKRIRILAMLIAIGIVTLFSSSGWANFIYSVHADAGQGFAAADFSIETPTILGFGNTATLNPVGSPDGFTVTSLSFDSELCFGGSCFDLFDTNTTFPPAGQIAGFEFEAADPVNAPGLYDIKIGRYVGIVGGNSISGSDFVSGTLDITSAPEPVPEPASLTLLSAGLLGLVGLSLVRHLRTYARAACWGS